MAHPTTALVIDSPAMQPRARRQARAAGTAFDSAASVESLWGDYLSLVAAQAAFAVSTLAGLALCARLLGPAGYGTVVLFMMVVQLCFIGGTKWCFPAVMRFAREALVLAGRAGEVVWSWSLLFLVAVIACSLGLLAASRGVRTLVGSDNPPVGLYLAVFVLTALSMAGVQLLQTQGRMKTAAWAPVAGKCLLILLLAGLAFASPWTMTPTTVVACVAAALTVQSVLSLAAVNPPLLRPVTVDWNVLRRLARYSLPLWAACVAGYLCEWVDLYFLRAFRGHADVGIYQIAYQVFLFLAGALAGLYTLLFPVLTAWVAEGHQERVHRYADRFIPQVSVLWGLLILLLGGMHRPGFSLVFGAAFTGSQHAFALLLAGLAFQPILVLYGTLLLSQDRPRENARVMLMMAALNVLGDIVLVPRWGMAGAALSTVTSLAVAALLCWRWSHRRLPFKRPAAVIASSLVAGALLAMALLDSRLTWLVVAGSAAVLVWWARAARLFSKADLSMLDYVRCPPWAKSLLAKVYAVFFAPGPWRATLSSLK